MRIEADIKLDYKDVLLRPKRSTMGSRKEVDLQRTYKFRNSRKEYTGIPIMAANMQGVGTFNMAEELIKVPLFTCLDKTYQPADIWDWLNNHVHKPDLCRNIAVSTGITDIDQERIDATLKLSRAIQYVNIDVANGYSFVGKRRTSLFPQLPEECVEYVTKKACANILLSLNYPQKYALLNAELREEKKNLMIWLDRRKNNGVFRLKNSGSVPNNNSNSFY